MKQKEWYGNNNVRASRREPRHYQYDTEFEFQGVEGVRVLTLWGGWAGFMSDISARAAADAPGFLGEVWDWGFARQTLLELAIMSAPETVDFFLEAITTIPRTWTFLDFIVLADGRRYARVWDASQYPSLYTYVDGVLKAHEDMPYETRQIWNETMFAFLVRAMAGATPYSNPLKYYEASLTSETISLEIERTINAIIDQLDLGWIASDLMPTIPRETLGFDGDASATETNPIDDPDGPFPRAEGLFFPSEAELPPE